MFHLHDLLSIAGALAVIVVILVHGDILDHNSLLWRALTLPAWLFGRDRPGEPRKRR